MKIKKSDEEIKSIVKKLGDSPMKPKSHGYEKYPGMKILDAAKKQAEEFMQGKIAPPAIALMLVVLAANRNYKKQVEPHEIRLKKQFPSLSFRDLKGMLNKHDYVKFKEIWGHKDQKKYDTLNALIDKLLEMKKANPAHDDYAMMHAWAKTAQLENKENDPLGSIPNVGVATFQHLRMTFGVDTVKPDQRVREVLKKEFGAKLSDVGSISAVEKIAKITGFKTIEIDQIFVKYGSGYYEPSQTGVIES